MLSPEAQKAIQAGIGRQMFREGGMAHGPHLSSDGVTIVIPAEAYNPQAAAFWKAQGFRWHPHWKTWERDTRTPANGKRYTAAAWLKAARRKYREFWPNWELERVG